MIISKSDNLILKCTQKSSSNIIQTDTIFMAEACTGDKKDKVNKRAYFILITKRARDFVRAKRARD